MKQAGAIILLSSAAASACVVAGLSWLYSTYFTLPEPDQVVTVMVANRDLHQGIPITDQDLYAVNLPKRFVPSGALQDPGRVIGRVPYERVLHNEFIRTGRLADPHAGTGLHALIPRNMRAMSIELGEAPALAGTLKGGHLVDLLVTKSIDESHRTHPNRDQETVTFLQAVFVLGVDGVAQEGDEEARKTPSVTLLLTPQQAEQVALAQTQGRLHLSLRSDMDHEHHEFIRQQFHNPVPAVAAPRRRTPTEDPGTCAEIVLIRGDHREVVGWNTTTNTWCTP